MEEEAVIITILKADHEDGFHSLPNEPNKYCPICIENIIVTEAEEFLKEVERGHHNNN